MAAFHAREQVGEHLRSLSWESTADEALVSEYRSESGQGMVRVSSLGLVALRHQPGYQPDLPAGELVEAILERQPLAPNRLLKRAGLSPWRAERWSD